MKNYNKYVSDLLGEIINDLNNNSIPYLFLRNFENYPNIITGDVDVIVQPDYIKRTKSLFEKRFELLKWKIFYSDNNPRILSYQLFRLDIPDNFRNVLVIEVFKGFNLIGFEYAVYKNIYKYVTFVNNLYALQSPYGVLLSLVHYMARAGFYPQKYSLVIKKAFEERSIINNLLSQLFSNKTTNQIIKFINDESSSNFVHVKNIPEKIRIVHKRLLLKIRFELILKSFLLHFIKSSLVVPKLFSEVFIRIINPAGEIVLINFIHSAKLGEDIFNKIKQLHLYKNSASIFISNQPIKIRKIAMCVHNGGVAIIDLNNNRLSIFNKIIMKLNIYKVIRLNSPGFVLMRNDLVNNSNAIVDNYICQLLHNRNM